MKITLQNLERLIKKARGKDVPALDVEIPKEIIDLVAAAEKLIIHQALELIEEVKDEAYAVIVKFANGEIIITRQMFDAVVKSLLDSIGAEKNDTEEGA